ncbi:HET-domain-containing protein [Hyaloscypha hepaticicola]|uniref:HET-domain-containing protein n=1 Tax=Hyaloscypha hepaticicola TaxID=2082293 RepID=A0A2J6PYY7_9HELO|nr:HET-domain-containing protein [Hyaloscypha hepaticicola]
MTRCRNEHDHQCNNVSLENVPFLRLIDCQSRKVIRAPPNSEYTALSYVWGVQVQAGDSEVSQNQPVLDPHKCPKAINDSVQVTLDLNIKYLWVDKYCIDQFDDQDKVIQIGQVDSIYANAAVTIIAAARDEPHHGLPGVDGTLRNMQPALKVGDHLIASMLGHGTVIVSNSKWATRRWTYQEGILSKRRLMFTDEQVHWECNNTHYAETIHYKPTRKNST